MDKLFVICSSIPKGTRPRASTKEAEKKQAEQVATVNTISKQFIKTAPMKFFAPHLY